VRGMLGRMLKFELFYEPGLSTMLNTLPQNDGVFADLCHLRKFAIWCRS
jgi:hypothetical protein